MSDLTRGDIVECIDDQPKRPESRVMPVLGTLYTVASVRAVEGGYSVRLRELTPSCYLGGVCACGDCGWDAGRFRKAPGPKSDLIALFARKTPEPV